MTVVRTVEAIPHDPASVVTVGTFDGIHRGHQLVVTELVRRATGGRSVLVTFAPHPQEVLRGTGPLPLLTPLPEKAELLGALGLDLLVVIPFTEAFSRLTSTEFVESIIVGRIGLREAVVGYDHAFGHNREGSIETFRRLAPIHGFTVDQLAAVELDMTVISSSRIRRLLSESGDVATAATLLGRPYELIGEVVPGDRRGRLLGYPTANLSLTHAERKLVPKHGVYAVTVALADGTVRGGMMNIGTRPTFDGQETRIEVHLFDHTADLYGQALRVALHTRLRDEQRFPDLAALRVQLDRDADTARAALSAMDPSASG